MRGTLDPARIVREAIEQIDEQGLASFSMRSLAKRLGVDPMAIYHHLPSREAVLDAVVDELFRQADLPTEANGWQSWVRTAGARFADLAESHPRTFPLIAVRGPTKAESLLPLEALAAALLRGGFGTDEVFVLVQMFSHYAISLAMNQLDAVVFGVEPATITINEVSPEQFPTYFKADRANATPRRIFDRGLEALIGGLEAELRQRRRRQSRDR